MEMIVQNDEELPAAIGAVRAGLAGIGVNEADLTNELYTDAVAAAGPA